MAQPPPAEPRTPARAGHRRFRLLLAGATVAIAVACAAAFVAARGGAHARARPPGAAAARSVADAGRSPTEGPATEPHTWPDGITATIVEVTRPGPNELPLGPESPVNDAGVVVTTEITNTGSGELRWSSAPAVPDGTLFYGEHRLPAHMYGWTDGTPLPARLVPGASVRWSMIGFLPGTQLGRLAYSMTPLWNDPARSVWTFTGVDRLLAGSSPGSPGPRPPATGSPARGAGSRVATGPPSRLTAAGR